MSLHEPAPERQSLPPTAHSVLIADDDDTLREQLATYLDRQGIRCLLAKDGAETLEILEAQRPEVVLLDVCLPDMSGLEIARRIRQATPRPEVILMSGYDDAVSEAKRADLEVLMVIEKPVPLWAVARALDQAFDRAA
ncbi:MAG: response regulator [Rhodospirillales bacterium]|nr:response regulator [Rhodospirillales bacterium]MDH3792913.1 response regulator [Rhodospirillales bacterium]MDH3913894.1 response regulator [Rhodospirillales bacterium]MDH3918256.1 response regulator [Rhodospirillales bacterium]MDH3965862.1 response regulator [Rhodospirillales bacterium]